MLVLAFDTSSVAVTVAVADGDEVLAARTEVAQNRQGELLAPLIADVLATAGVQPRRLDAIGVGLGPGPFTGLRVGVVTARAMADALDLPVHGECSLDVMAAQAGPPPAGLAVVTDARRKQVYWAGYDGAGSRLDGPDLALPDDLAARLRARGCRVVGAGVGLYPGSFAGLPAATEPAYPDAAVLARLVSTGTRSEPAPGSLAPLYLRRPDARPPGARKQVTPA